MRKILLVVISVFIASVCELNADNLTKAKTYYNNGNYELALPLFEKEYKKNKRNGSVNHWIGVCLYKLGRGEEAIKYFEYAITRKVTEAPHYLALIYSEQYKFDKASEMFAEYQSKLEEDKKQLSAKAKEELSYIKLAKSMLDHVEKIVILDSILVDKENFFEYYRLSTESGKLIPAEALPIKTDRGTVGFINQSESRMLWSMPDENGSIRICESARLTDGSWDTPHFIDNDIRDGGDLNYPYLMQDGATLYYASNGEGTLGGYDIYFTRKDSETGEFLRPQNMGMPYNSSADDYMLVLDDVTGFGWWATDRHNIEDKVTIYVFKRNDIRKNYRTDEENLVSFAKVSDYKLTWGGEDYQALVEQIHIMEEEASDYKYESDFSFEIKKGVQYDSFMDFKSKDAAQEMKYLLQLYDERASLMNKINVLRKQYSEGKNKESIGTEILASEAELERIDSIIFKTENWIRQTEQEMFNK